MPKTHTQRTAILLVPLLIIFLAAFVLIKSGSVTLHEKPALTAVCAEESGYMGAVTVYDSDDNALYKWYSASGLPICAEASPDGEMLAVLCAEKGKSVVHIFSLHSEDELSRCEYPDELFFKLGWMNEERLCVLSEKRACAVDTEGKSCAEFNYEGKCLGDFGIADGVMLSLRSNEAGGTAETVRLSSAFKIIK